MGSRSINRTTQTRPCVAVKNWHVMSAELRAMSAWPPMEPVMVYGAQRAAGRSSRWRRCWIVERHGRLETNEHRARRARPGAPGDRDV